MYNLNGTLSEEKSLSGSISIGKGEKGEQGIQGETPSITHLEEQVDSKLLEIQADYDSLKGGLLADDKVVYFQNEINEVNSSLDSKANQSDLDLANTKITTNTNDISVLKPQVQSLASGSPKGVYATISALTTAFPTGNTNIYVISADGGWYYWGGSAWLKGGTYQSTALENLAVKSNNIDSEVYTNIIGKKLYSVKSGVFEKASAIQYYYTIPSTLITSVNVKCKAMSLNVNNNSIATKVAVNGKTNNLLTGNYDNFSKDTMVFKNDTFSYNVTSTDITVYAWVKSTDELLPVEYAISPIELYINGVLVTATPTIASYNVDGYSNNISDYTFNSLLAPMSSVAKNSTDIANLQNNINNIDGDTQVKFTSDILNKDYIITTTHKPTSVYIYSINDVYTEDINVKKINLKISTTTIGSKQIEVIMVDSNLNIITDDIYNFTVSNTGINNVSIDVNINLLKGYRLCFLYSGDTYICYQDGSPANTLYSINGYIKSGSKIAVSQTNILGALSYSLDYVKSTTLPNILNDYAKKTDLPIISTNRLSGKKIVAIGDSMVQGHTLSANQTWLYNIANRNNMTYVNYGINGTFMTNKLYGSYQGVVDRYSTMDSDTDYIIVFAGTNDANSLVTIGTDNSTNPSEFKGALNLICDGLITKYPNKLILFITPYLRNSSYQQYVDAIEIICAKYGIRVFNNVKNGGVCWTNNAQISALTLNDTYHLNEQGMLYASYKYEEELRRL